MFKAVVLIFAVIVAVVVSQNPACKAFNYVALGGKCDVAKFPEIANTTTQCDYYMGCAKSDGKCAKSVQHEFTCTTDDDCTSAFNYKCYDKKCTYKRNFGQACSHNDQCFSGVCTASKCDASGVGVACTSNINCKIDPPSNTFLYCSKNDNFTCQAVANVGEVCTEHSGCKSGLYCIFTAFGQANGTCKATVGDGQTCGYGYDSNPYCSSGYLCYWDSLKCAALQTRTQGQPCQIGDHCAAGLACNGTVCLAEGSVSCSKSSPASEYKCKSIGNKGYCKCTSDSQAGVCASDLKETNYCAADNTAYATCLNTNCNYWLGRGFSFPLGDNCASTKCSAEVKKYICCLKGTAGLDLPADFANYDCSTPAVTPKTSPKKSGGGAASTIVVSSFAVVAALISFM